MPEVTVVIPNYNRREVLGGTLARLASRRDEADMETIVIDNASSDGAPEMVQREFGWVRLIRLDRNIATAARNVGIEEARGRYILMLDSDSSPEPSAIARMVDAFEREADLGVVAFRVLLPDGTADPVGAYNVFIGCGAGFRADLLRHIGGYPTDYHYYVEEYDVSFRILQTPYRIGHFRDIVARHEKSADERDMNTVLYYLVRNNIKLWHTYLPPESAWPVIGDTVERYGMIARKESAIQGYTAGVADALRSLPDATRRPLSAAALARALPCGHIQAGLAALKSRGVDRLSVWTMGKHAGPFLEAAKLVGIDLDRIYDDLLAATIREYRGIPVSPKRDLPSRADVDVMIASASLGAIENERNALAQHGVGVHYLFDYDEADKRK